VTRRALLLGAGAVVLISVATPYSDLVMGGTWIGLTALPITAVFLLSLLVLLNALLRRWHAGLARQEMLTIFLMALAAAGIPSFGLTGLLVPYLAGPLYFAAPENHYREAVVNHLPHWALAPGLRAATALYEGLAPHGSIPWAGWLPTLGAWIVLVAGVYLVFFCLSALVRRPWVEDEKLVFPLVQLPAEITNYDSPRAAFAPLLRDPLTWAFFLIPFSIHMLNGLHRYFAALPSLNVHLIDIGAFIIGPEGEAVKPLWIRLLFGIVGLSYLLPSDLSFSLWFFYFFFLAQQLTGAHFGYVMPSVQAYPVREFVAQQMAGGIIVFGLYALWTARGHLSKAISQAARLRKDRSPDEPMSPASAAWGIALGLAVIVAWGSAVGAGSLYTLLIFVLFFLMHMVGVRLVAAGGMLYVQHPYRPLNLMLDAAGTSGLGPSRLPSLALFDHLWMLDNRSPLMPGVLQGYKLAGLGSIRLPWAMGAMAFAVMLAVPLSLWAYMHLMYTRGGLALNQWFTSYYTNNLYSNWTTSLVLVGRDAHPAAFATCGLGAFTMLLLLALHRNFLWWPLHPIGYAMGASWPMINYWFSIMLGWIFKVLVLRYGGARIYRRFLPAALGLIFGEFFSGGLWVLIDFCTGMKGHEIFSF
jgi:hypothetical protein